MNAPVAASKVSPITRAYEDPLLRAAVAEGAITRSQAEVLLVAPAAAPNDEIVRGRRGHVDTELGALGGHADDCRMVAELRAPVRAVEAALSERDETRGVI